MPAMGLQEFMRHETVMITENFYLDIDADSTTAMLTSLLHQGDTLTEERKGARTPVRKSQ